MSLLHVVLHYPVSHKDTLFNKPKLQPHYSTNLAVRQWILALYSGNFCSIFSKKRAERPKQKRKKLERLVATAKKQGTFDRSGNAFG